MIDFLELTLAKKTADATKQTTYIPSEIEQKNFHMDNVVLQRIDLLKTQFDTLDNIDDNEKSVIAMHITYSRMKNENFNNPFLANHIRSFKSEGSFVGYYKEKLGLNGLDIIS